MEAVDQFLAREGADAITCLPETIIPDLKRAPSIAAHKGELVRGERVRYHLAVLAQHQHIAALNRIEHAYREGFGRRVASVHPKIAQALAIEYGPSWFRDRKLLYRVLKENPCLAVNCRPPKTRVLVNGFRDKAGINRKSRNGSAGHATQGDPAGPQVKVREAPKRSGHETAGNSTNVTLDPVKRNSRRSEEPWMIPVLEGLGEL
jgi:hypothetical protein